MPYTPKQRRLFNAAEHDPAIAREHGMSGREADELAGEANDLAREGREKKPVEKADAIDLVPIYRGFRAGT